MLKFPNLLVVLLKKLFSQLFSDTIYNNITLFNDKIDESQLGTTTVTSSGFRLNNRINTNDLTKDNKINSKYINDQLVHDRISFKLYSEINNQINLVVERCDRIKLKVLLYHGTEDKIISCESIKILS